MPQVFNQILGQQVSVGQIAAFAFVFLVAWCLKK